MVLKSLHLRDFRNYTEQEVSFADGMNILMGDNAQGKTNLVDAVMLVSLGKCPRVTRDRELIRWNADRARVQAEVVKRYGDDEVEAVIDKTVVKCVSVNRMPLTRLGELMGVVATVLFSPEQMSIVKDAPGERRRFMDIALCQLSKPYFYLLNRYNRILSQRNKLIKSGNHAAIEVWDMQLAHEGARIIKTRRGFIERLSVFAAAAHSRLSGGKETLCLSYEGIAGDTAETIEAAFIEELARTRESDLRLGFTHAGPQRDDIRITVGDVDCRTYGSQGQQRTAALSLKLAELELYRAESGEAPVLLLDDVLSELDPGRQRQLLQSVDVQTIVTCTHISSEIKDALRGYRAMRVSAGRIAEVEDV